MGIQGVYKEIGSGERIALSKLAALKFEETGRPLRIAVDTSIWLFQIQSGKGGSNPALRTFYYRLLRLMTLAIHPIFVFDGPNKPPVKRNKRVGGPNVSVSSIPEFLAKQLLQHFGFPIHMAPGEAEAECALLQREGVVDMVMTEDVDALMFGAGMTLRNWTTNEKKGKTPTHVNLFDSAKIKAGSSGLDREGMILVALMSGGDYVPQGIPGCGPKLACEAARAGFGADLCKIKRSDKTAFKEWRERLEHELHTNESKFFRSKHSALKLPEDFPSPEILGYYLNPAISKRERALELKDSITWDNPLDFPALRKFTAEAFDWRNFSGAKKFIRNLAPALLVRELSLGASNNKPGLLKGIHHQPRTHQSTDGMTELRVSYVANDIVDIDLSAEPADDEIENGYGEDEDAEMDAEDLPSTQVEGAKRGPYLYDPTKLEKIWLLETFVKAGAQTAFIEWQKKQEEAAVKSAASESAKLARLQKQQEKQQENQKATNSKVIHLDPSVREGVMQQLQQYNKLTKQTASSSTDRCFPSSQPIGSGLATSTTSRTGRTQRFEEQAFHPFSSTQPAPTIQRIESIDLSGADKPVPWAWPPDITATTFTNSSSTLNKRMRSPSKAQSSVAMGSPERSGTVNSPSATPKPKRTKKHTQSVSPTKRHSPVRADDNQSTPRRNLLFYFSPTPSPEKGGTAAATKVDSLDMISPSYSPSPEARRMRAQQQQQKVSEFDSRPLSIAPTEVQRVIDLTISSPVQLPLRPSDNGANHRSRGSESGPSEIGHENSSSPTSRSKGSTFLNEVVQNNKLEVAPRPLSDRHSWVRIRKDMSGGFMFGNYGGGPADKGDGEFFWRIADIEILDMTGSRD